ncbi:LysM peptidoglycan-binding domain-containing protein [uncultured Algimonas sp.]|uniref:LysM peptidoglycan-binding domain-containing protein n=1 Tax=uncultured Algimonas sp. TaxID=1547920 RepID=UPI002630F002|nr:LysM peptidoglycan-binding domain-containing protein [uncultured Algimonas sp.]
MSIRLLFVGSALALAACSTVQENPNYQYSSKYVEPDLDTAPVLAAEARTVAGVQYSAIPAAHPELAGSERGPETAVSPTEHAYDTDRMTGTPGYEMMVAQQSPHQPAPFKIQPTPQAVAPRTAPVQAPRPLVPGQPREVNYDFAQNTIGGNVIAAPAPAPQGPVSGTAASMPAVGLSYTVQQGDTVYSLSRRLCVPVGEITAANAIGGDYAIAIGQTLALPGSRCG